MSQTTSVVRGVLNPDGTLELDAAPSLPAGRVEVTIRFLSTDDPAEDLWQYMQRTRAELEASGHGFRAKEEIDADLDAIRDWDGKDEQVHRAADGEPGRENGA